MASRTGLLVSTLSLMLAGCATIPYGPAVPVVPGGQKTLSDFQHDDAICRRFAHEQVNGLTPADAATSSAAKSAIVGTALGAAAGAAFGGGHGAAIGAGTGLLAGGAVGAGTAAASADSVQYRYDNAYAQCMTLQGNRLPYDYERTAAASRADAYGYEAPPYYGPGTYETYEYDYYEGCPHPYYHGHHHHRHGHHHHHYYY